MPGRALALAVLVAAVWIGEPEGRQDAPPQDAPPPVETGASSEAEAATPQDATPQDATPQDTVEGIETAGGNAAADEAAAEGGDAEGAAAEGGDAEGGDAEGGDAEDAAPEPPPEVLEIGDGLYVLPYCGNATLRLTAHGVVLAGDRLAQYRAEIARLLATVTDQRIAYELHPHGHGADDDFAAAVPGSRRVGPARGAAPTDEPAAPPDIVFTSRLSLFLGDAEIRVRHVGGGHSGADAVVAFPDRGAVHVGRLVTDGPPLIDYARGGSAGGWIRALDDLLALEFDILVPGAGPVLAKSDAQAFRDRLVTLRTRIEQLVRRGVAKEDAVRRLETTDLGWPLDPAGGFARETLPDLYDEVAEGP